MMILMLREAYLFDFYCCWRSLSITITMDDAMDDGRRTTPTPTTEMIVMEGGGNK